MIFSSRAKLKALRVTWHTTPTRTTYWHDHSSAMYAISILSIKVHLYLFSCHF